MCGISLLDTQSQTDHLLSPLISKEEIQTSINSFREKTSPGSDGLPIEFYKTLSPNICLKLSEIYDIIYITQNLTKLQKLGIVKMIPKVPKPTDPSQWRPISLLNLDYKILAKIIAQRLTHHLTSYISTSQKCGLSGRKIDHVHQNILATIEYCKDTHSHHHTSARLCQSV